MPLFHTLISEGMDATAMTHPVADDDVVELPVLLPEWQVAALETAARDRGMTIGQLLRKLFTEMFEHVNQVKSA